MHSPGGKEKLSYRDRQGPISGDRKSQGLTKAFHLEVSVAEDQLSIPLSYTFTSMPPREFRYQIQINKDFRPQHPGQIGGQAGHFHIQLVGVQRKQLFWRTIHQKAARILTTHHSFTSSSTEGMFTSALFVIVKNWK